jgi:hypothetical protein
MPSKSILKTSFFSTSTIGSFTNAGVSGVFISSIFSSDRFLMFSELLVSISVDGVSSSFVV